MALHPNTLELSCICVENKVSCLQESIKIRLRVRKGVQVELRRVRWVILRLPWTGSSLLNTRQDKWTLAL